MSMVLTPFGWQFVPVNGSQIMPKTRHKTVVPWYPNVKVQRQKDPASATISSSDSSTENELATNPAITVTSQTMDQRHATCTTIENSLHTRPPSAPPRPPASTAVSALDSENDPIAVPNERSKRAKVRRIGSIRCSKCNKFGLRTECCADALYFVVVRSKFIPKQIQSGIGRRSFQSFKEADVFRRCVAQRVKQRRQNRRLTEEQCLKQPKDQDRHRYESYAHPNRQQQRPLVKRRRVEKVMILAQHYTAALFCFFCFHFSELTHNSFSLPIYQRYLL